MFCPAGPLFSPFALRKLRPAFPFVPFAPRILSFLVLPQILSPLGAFLLCQVYDHVVVPESMGLLVFCPVLFLTGEYVCFFLYFN